MSCHDTDPARPTSLILPYDDTFLPETGLPGIGIDLALLSSTTSSTSTQQSTLWSSSPAVSQSSASGTGNIQLELPSDDVIRDATYTGVDSDVEASAQKRGLFGAKRKADLEDEEGVLLQPDFEFDDLGNIVEFDASHLSPHKRRRTSASPHGSEGFSWERVRETDVSVSPQDGARELFWNQRFSRPWNNPKRPYSHRATTECKSITSPRSKTNSSRASMRLKSRVPPSLRKDNGESINNDRPES